MSQTLYLVIRYQPMPKRMLRREGKLVCEEHILFATTHHKLAKLAAWWFKGHIEEDKTYQSVIEFGTELSEDFCDIYKVKTTAEAFRVEAKNN